MAEQHGAELALLRERAGLAEGEVRVLRETLREARAEAERSGWRRLLGL